MDFFWCYGHRPAFEDAASVRKHVFVKEQGYSLQGELDGQDATSWHIVGYEKDVPVCTARLFCDTQTAGTYHVGRVAVLPALRGKGAGLQMMAKVEEKAKNLGVKRLVLNAQSDKTFFYERAGFTATGATSLDEGCPHTEMEKIL